MEGFFPVDGFVFDTHTDIQNGFIKRIHTEGTACALEWLGTVKNGQECSYPRSLSLSWPACDTNAYLLEIAENEDFQDALCITTDKNCWELHNLKIGQTYYWRVNGGEIHYFQTENSAPRFIKIDGALNVRDLGGNKIKQGIIYRGTEFDEYYHLAPDGYRSFVEDLKIKTELDLRGESNVHLEISPLKNKVNIIQYWYRPYMEVFEEQHKKKLCKIMEVFADEQNYPIYMHCVGGADRTGMVALYLRALVGESDDDIHTDYELTGLSTYAYGISEGATGYRNRTSPYYVEFLEELRKGFDLDAPLSVVVKSFLLNCGVTQECINKIIKIIKK